MRPLATHKHLAFMDSKVNECERLIIENKQENFLRLCKYLSNGAFACDKGQAIRGSEDWV